nr:uncharacterized protein LOC128672166 [Plodia interpunctella]
MVTYCTVCMNNTRRNKDISYFNYPKDSNRMKWLNAVGREDLVLKIIDDNTRQRYRICEDHFERSNIFFAKNKTKKYLCDNAFPTLNLPSNDGAISSQLKSISAQENQDIQVIHKTEPCSSPDIFLNNTAISQDQISRSIKTEPDEQTNEHKAAQTASHLLADSPNKRKLTLELPEAKKHKTCALDSVTKEDFLKLCGKFLTKRMSQIIKRQLDVKTDHSVEIDMEYKL